MVQSRVAVRSSGMQDDDKVSRGGKRKESPMCLAGMNGGACMGQTCIPWREWIFGLRAWPSLSEAGTTIHAHSSNHARRCMGST